MSGLRHGWRRISVAKHHHRIEAKVTNNPQDSFTINSRSVTGKRDGVDSKVVCIDREVAQAIKQIDGELDCSAPKVLLLEGIWQVPPAERPKNWERFGGKEKG